MNIGYIIDLNNIITPDALDIPHLTGLYYQHIFEGELTPTAIRRFRDEVVMKEEYAGLQIDKHIFFMIVKNDLETIKELSLCLDSMQRDVINFNQAQYEVHVIFNLIDEGGISIGKYEEMMPCLKNNAVCIYTWLIDKYEFSGSKPIIDIRRAHAIARLAWMVCKHRHELSLVQMHIDQKPIYNLFGDASVFFNEEERNDAVRNYYYFKSLQHLLNLSDSKLDEYLKEHVLPFRDDPAKLEKRIDSSSVTFLRDQRVPIEATLITEKTQDLLIKSSDDDKEYLVNAADNNLVFIDDLSHKQQWQLEDTDLFIKKYRDRVFIGEEMQETISDEFIADLQEKLIIHNRTVFNAVNNVVSKNRRGQIESFKEKVDKNLTRFLNSQGRENYTKLSEILTPKDVKLRCSNIDKGIAFLEYLKDGKGDYLVDEEVSVGDTNLTSIKIAIDEKESRLYHDFKDKENEYEQKNKAGDDGRPSPTKAKFDVVDKEINKHKEDIRLLNYQLEHWYDSDTVRKFTARTRSVIALGIGLLASILWIFPYLKWIRPALKAVLDKTKTDPSSFYTGLARVFKTLKGIDKFEWSIFFLFILVGLIVAFCIVWKVIRKRKESEMMLQKAKEKKKRLIHDCVEDVKSLVERHYKHMLAFHGKKTMAELLEYVQQKEADLISFRKTVFRLMLKYRLSIPETAHSLVSDQNTIEINDIDVKRLLFGPEGQQGREIPFCFAGGISLSDTFEYFKRKKVRLETTRFSPGFSSQEDFDPFAIEHEVIPARKDDLQYGIEYTPLQKSSVLPDTKGVGMDDVHQGGCGDCYFMATLAAIAQMNPEYIVSKNGMIQELGEDHKFFRVKFYDKNGERVHVDVDNKFWNKNGRPFYAKEGNSNPDEPSYDPWVMAVEKAWAKANNEGYDGIEGGSPDGIERSRKVEYSFAVTGKSAYYCMTQNVPNRNKLEEMMMKHFLSDHLPITLYSANSSDSAFPNKDPYLVESHAYALKSVNSDGTFDIFNPWNSHEASEEIRGKHFEHVDINFIKDNFNVIVFFGIKESDFSYFERDLTENASEKEVEKEIEKVLSDKFDDIDLAFHNMGELMTDDIMDRTYINASYLFNKARIKDDRGVNKDGHHIIFLEPARDCEEANNKLMAYLRTKGQFTVHLVSFRPDAKKNLTLLRLSPGFVLPSFND